MTAPYPGPRPLGDRLARVAVRALDVAPRGLKRRLAGRPVTVDGQTLDVDVQLALRALNRSAGETFETLPIDAAREQIEREAWIFGSETPVASVVETTVAGAAGPLPARVYRPAGAPSPAPALVYFHGGGWALGDLGSCDAACRFLAAHADVVVVSVAYRLAPEHPFPAGVDDARAAYEHVVRHADELGIDPNAVAVGGESAGGNLAAVVALDAARDPHDVPAPALQVLLMPVTDLTTKRPSYGLFRAGYFLTEAQMDWYAERYVADPARRHDPRVSPLLAGDLSGVAPAHVVVAGFDVLRDEGEAYAARLEAAGVPVVLRRHAALIHGIVNATGASSAARDALLEIAAALRRSLSSPPARAPTPAPQEPAR